MVRSFAGAHPFQLAGWQVHPAANELVRGAEVRRLEPRVMEVLVVLAERAGTPISREALLEQVWPGVFVTEAALSRCIYQLRKLFEDDARVPRVIETLPKVGYRLVAPVQPIFSGDADGTAFTSAPSVSLTVTPSPATRQSERAAVSWRALAAVGVLVALAAGALVAGLLNRPIPAPVLAAVVPLTTMPGPETMAALSPDGNRVAFVARSDDQRSQVWVQGVGEGAARRLSGEGGFESSPTWSPDGTQVAFVRCAKEGCQIRTASILGGATRKQWAGPTFAAGGLSWAPDGRSLVFVALEDQRRSLWLLDLEQGTARRLTTPPPRHLGDTRPSYSPDGRWIAFLRAESPAFIDLYVLPAAGGTPRRVTHDRRSIAGLTWTDSETLVFASMRGGDYQLWKVARTGGEPVHMASIPSRDAGGPVFSPARSRLVFEEWSVDTNIWRAEPGREPTPLIRSTARDTHPAASPDGRLAFVSDRSGTWELWTSRSDGSDPVRRTRFEGGWIGRPRWSPDGKHLVFHVQNMDRPGLYVLDAEGGVPALVAGTASGLAPRWSADGHSLYFAAQRTGQWEVWRVPAAGGSAVQVTHNGGYAAAEGPDGLLVYSKFGVYGLWVLPPDGNEYLLTDQFAANDGESWWIDEGDVVFPRHTAEATQLVRVPLGKARLAAPDAGVVLPPQAYSLTPQGDGGILFSLADRVESDLVMVDSGEQKD